MASHHARGAAIVGSLLVLPLAAGCGTDDGADTADKQKPSAVAAAPAKVEKIAELADCEANIRIEAEQLREGVCRTSMGDFVVTTFPKEKYKLTWLDSARMYGGEYLVGPRWAIGAKPEVLERLRPKVGGTIQKLDRNQSPGPTADTK